MAKTLGLDIGTNSIGWAITNSENGVNKLIDLGVRIFPVGVVEDKYNKSSVEEPKSKARRDARSARRLYMRYVLRRKQLREILAVNNMLPEQLEALKGTKPTQELYLLRKKAIDKQISLKELGRLFLLLNQRRGFKSSKKDKGGDKETSKLKKEMAEFEKVVYNSGARTIGEYFANLLIANKDNPNWHNDDEPTERIRKRFIYRRMYELEFDTIWNKQKEYYIELTGDVNQELHSKDRGITLEEKGKRKAEYKQTLHYKIKNHTIFYQRGLKSAKHLVGRCQFEPKKRVAPRSAFAFQEFRVWQTVAHLKLTIDDRIRDFLSIDERKALAGALMQKDRLTQNEIKKLLDIKGKVVFEGWDDKIKGNTTATRLKAAIGDEFYNSLPEGSEEDKGNSVLTKYRLWHTLFFASDDDWLYSYAKEVLKLNDEQAEKFSQISLEPDYGSISIKALKNILPYLKEGYNYADACQKAGYHHSYKEEEDSKDRALFDKILPLQKDEKLRNPIVEQGLSETIRLVNAVIAKYGKPDQIRVEMLRSLKKPKSVREQMRSKNQEKERQREEYYTFLKNKLGRNHIPKVDILKYELWLEMGCEPQDIEGFDEFRKNVKASDKEKYQLWMECNRICPYTNKVIGLEELFTAQVHIEHILPYSKTMDNSFANKTVCWHEFNTDEKKDQTPYQYFKNDPQAWEAFVSRVKQFPEYKQDVLLTKEIPDGFLNSQLNNSAYIARQARKKLKTVCNDVRISNGQTTALLRRMWGLNDLLDENGQKNRNDHRHHAIDAVVVAYTTDNYINLLSQQSEIDGYARIRVSNIRFPYEKFKLDVNELLSKTLISYRNKKRLVTYRKNKYIHSAAAKQEDQKRVPAIRGWMHEETYYGRINNPHTNEQTYVIRKDLSAIADLKQIHKVIDPVIRQILLDQVEAFGGKVKEALKARVYIYSKDGVKKIPIKKVRMAESSTELLQLRGDQGPYVATGNNYCFALYEDAEKGKRDFETVTFFDAAQRKLKGEPIVPQTKNGKPLLTTLQQKDLVIWYNNHPDEIEWDNPMWLHQHLYRVVKFDKNGLVSFALHNYSNVKVDKPKEYPEGVVLGNRNYNTYKGVKVEIDLLGNLKQI
jgi:CRISPR-associated endonuclease Csn1